MLSKFEQNHREEAAVGIAGIIEYLTLHSLNNGKWLFSAFCSLFCSVLFRACSLGTETTPIRIEFNKEAK